MEKTEFLPNVQTEEKKENTAPVQSDAVNADMNAAAQQKITSIRQERAGMKNELAEFMGGIES